MRKNLTEVVFILGANINAGAVGEKMGIDRDCSVTFHSDSEGTLLNYSVVCDATSQVRAGEPIQKSWKKRIEKRGK